MLAWWAWRESGKRIYLSGFYLCMALGISSMAYGGEIGHRNSAQWMVLRVGFQALALLLIVIALSAR